MTSADASPARADASWAVHATAVAIQGWALLIRGPSKVGKSRLALSLIAAATTRRPIILIGDDRLILTPHPDGLIVSPHPRIAGFIERRGLGILSMPFMSAARLGGVLDLLPPTSRGRLPDDAISIAGSNFPLLSIVLAGASEPGDVSDRKRRREVLDWFSISDKGTTHFRESVS